MNTLILLRLFMKNTKKNKVVEFFKPNKWSLLLALILLVTKDFFFLSFYMNYPMNYIYWYYLPKTYLYLFLFFLMNSTYFYVIATLIIRLIL